MFRFLEGKYQPLAPLRVFYSRVGKCFLATLVIVGFSLAIGRNSSSVRSGVAIGERPAPGVHKRPRENIGTPVA